jgi:hypothetical protein
MRGEKDGTGAPTARGVTAPSPVTTTRRIVVVGFVMAAGVRARWAE